MNVKMNRVVAAELLDFVKHAGGHRDLGDIKEQLEAQLDKQPDTFLNLDELDAAVKGLEFALDYAAVDDEIPRKTIDTIEKGALPRLRAIRDRRAQAEQNRGQR